MYRRVGFLLFTAGWGANHFASLLVVYQKELGLSPAELGLLFGMYALGLVPGLVLSGRASDARGRRAVVLPASLVALVASAVLAFGGHGFGALLAGRLLYGLAMGSVMTPGSVWVQELSPPELGPRRATLVLSAGFGLGPLVTGLVAQYAPAPMVLPFLLHIIVLSIALVLLRGVPETAPRAIDKAASDAPRPLPDRNAWNVLLRLLPVAPWAFGFAAIPVAILPGLMRPHVSRPVLYSAFVIMVALLSGVLVQPLTTRLGRRSDLAGLGIGALGTLVGAHAVATTSPGLVIAAAVLLGTGYGLVMTNGLREIAERVPKETRGMVVGVYYVLTYVGFALPFLHASAARTWGDPTTLRITAAAAVTSLLVRVTSTFDRTMKFLAAALLLSVLAGALHDVSRAWDVWYYHLPFAARIAGIVPSDAFVFHAADQARFDGFPLLGEALQGALWRLTGRPESANLVAYASVPLFAWFLRRAFGVPWPLTVFALFAIPLVQIHATSAYVDLPANVAASVVVLLAIRAHATRANLERGTLMIGVVSAAVAANMKVMMGPIVLLALAALAWELLRQRRAAPVRDKLRWSAVAAGALAMIFATPLKNAALHGNPWYPVQVKALGFTFAGPEQPYSFTPAWLTDKPRIVRFACSLLEIGLRPYSSTRRWTIDQFMPPDEPGSRLGGYFGVYVVVMVLALGVLVWRGRSRRARVSASGFGAFTLLVSFMPQAHELRYYLCWMIVLVALVLWLAQPDVTGEAPTDQPPRRTMGGRWLYAVCMPALLVVIVVTRAACIYPSGVGFTELLAEQVNEGALEKVGVRVCVDRAPWNILFAARFHPPRRYVVHEAEGPADCRGAPELP